MLKKNTFEVSKENIELKDGKIVIDTENLEGLNLTGEALDGEEGANGFKISIEIS